MSHSSYDIRKCIRETIGTPRAICPGSWDDKYCIPAQNKYGEAMYIPIYLAEEVKSETQPSMPFIDIKMMMTTYTPQDVGALSRKHEAFLDIGVWFANTDEVDSTEFGKSIVDEIQNQIRTTQEECGFHECPIDFITIRSVRYLEETNAKQVIYHYVVEVYVIYYD